MKTTNKYEHGDLLECKKIPAEGRFTFERLYLVYNKSESDKVQIKDNDGRFVTWTHYGIPAFFAFVGEVHREGVE